MFVTTAMRELSAYVGAPLPSRPDPCTCAAGRPHCKACVGWERRRNGEKPQRGERILSREDLLVRIVIARADLRQARAAKQRERIKNIYNQLRRYRKRLALMKE